jgi:hypothetical protein
MRLQNFHLQKLHSTLGLEISYSSSNSMMTKYIHKQFTMSAHIHHDVDHIFHKHNIHECYVLWVRNKQKRKKVFSSLHRTRHLNNLRTLYTTFLSLFVIAKKSISHHFHTAHSSSVVYTPKKIWQTKFIQGSTGEDLKNSFLRLMIWNSLL